MSNSIPLYRTTKTRNARTQQQLTSASLKFKHSRQNVSDEDFLYQTYDINLPESSINLLRPVITGLTSRNEYISLSRRNLYTVGIWREDSYAIYRCCFVQPELSSATCSFSASWLPSVKIVLSQVMSDLPDVTPCRLTPSSRSPQLSGRMAPYVVDRLPFSKVTWGFCNVSGSYLLFLKSDVNSGQRILTLTHDAIIILKRHFPSYSICVADVNTHSHKITVTPIEGSDKTSANKNTCMFIYNDGSFRLQGRPDAMERVCKSVSEAVATVMTSISSSSFLSKLSPIQKV